MNEKKKPKIKGGDLLKGENLNNPTNQKSQDNLNINHEIPLSEEKPQENQLNNKKDQTVINELQNTENTESSNNEENKGSFDFLDKLGQSKTAEEFDETLDKQINKDENSLETNSPNDVPNSYIPIIKEENNEEDISSRTGNYILTLGLPGSGKTTIQSFMTYTAFNYSGGKYIKGRTFPSFHMEHLNRLDGSRDLQAEAIINSWEISWKKGMFPKATDMGEENVREIRLKFTNNQNKKQSFDLSFLEVSGEDLNYVRVNEDWASKKPYLMEKLNKFLVNPNINLNFVWVIDPEQMEENDDLFRNFMSHFKTLERVNRSQISLMLVVAKPKQALKVIRSTNSEYYQKLEKFNNEKSAYDVARLCARWTVEQYKNWDKRKRGIMVFDIGSTEERNENTFLIKPEYLHSRRFIEWHYNQFTGKTFKEPFFKRLWR